MRATSPKLKDTNGSSDANTLMEMCDAMDEVRCHNLTLKCNYHNTRQGQQDSNLVDEMELLDS